MTEQSDRDSDPVRQGFKAIYDGDTERLKQLLQTQTFELETLSMFFDTAAEEGLIPCLELLVKLEPRVNISGALPSAADEGRMETVQWLLDHGARVNSIEHGVQVSTSLASAASAGHLAVVKLLVQKGAQFDTDIFKESTVEVREYLQSLNPKTPIERRRDAGVLGGRSAATLPGEFDHLAEVVDNLNDDSLKLKYAEWLESQNDPRGAFLRKFVAASKSMKLSGFPDMDGLPEDWLRLMACQLTQDIVEWKLSKRKEAILGRARPVARLIETEAEDKQVPVGASKLGGLPDLPARVKWPRGKDCTCSYQEVPDTEELCGFLGQINFADLAGTLVGRRLPTEGLLSFFGYYDFDNCDDGVRVLYFPDVTKLKRAKEPESLTEANEIQPTKALSFEEGLDLPGHNGPWKQDLGLPKSNDYGCLFRNYGTPFLGYFQGTTGEDVTPNKNWQHLISLAPHVHFHLQIHNDDLQAKNFDKVQVVWIDYD